MQIKCQTLFVAVAFLLSLTTASAQVPYGLAPDTVTAADISAQGSGENGYAAALIALVPNDPVFARLKGQTIVGVRCNLRADYKQKSQKRSYAMACEGTPTNQVRRTNVNFSAGWNDVLFDEPLTIGDDTIFVGYQVYETIGTSLPITGYSGASVDGGCWLNIKNGGWTSYSDRGTLLISALLADGSEELIGNAAYVQCVEHPLTVAPSAYFGGTVYVHNLSSQPLASLAIAMQGEGDAASTIGQLTFDEAIPAYRRPPCQHVALRARQRRHGSGVGRMGHRIQRHHGSRSAPRRNHALRDAGRLPARHPRRRFHGPNVFELPFHDVLPRAGAGGRPRRHLRGPSRRLQQRLVHLPPPTKHCSSSLAAMGPTTPP